jgi:hypothetical protein
VYSKLKQQVFLVSFVRNESDGRPFFLCWCRLQTEIECKCFSNTSHEKARPIHEKYIREPLLLTPTAGIRHHIRIQFERKK